jgi:hypothetical protein
MTRIEIIKSGSELFLHFAVFFLASLLLVASGLSKKFYVRTRRELQYKLAWVAPMLVLAVISELVQGWIPGRVLDPLDLLFNLGGVACAACLVGLYYEMAPVVRAYQLREWRASQHDPPRGIANTDGTTTATTSRHEQIETPKDSLRQVEDPRSALG